MKQIIIVFLVLWANIANAAFESLKVDAPRGSTVWGFWKNAPYRSEIPWPVFRKEFARMRGMADTKRNFRTMRPGIWVIPAPAGYHSSHALAPISVPPPSEITSTEAFTVEPATSATAIASTPILRQEILVPVVPDSTLLELQRLQNELNELKQKVANTEAIIAGYEAEISKRDARIGELEAMLAEVNEQLVKNHQVIASQQNEIQTLLGDERHSDLYFWLFVFAVIIILALLVLLLLRKPKVIVQNNYREDFFTLMAMAQKYLLKWDLPPDMVHEKGLNYILLPIIGRNEGGRPAEVQVPGVRDPVNVRNLNSCIRKNAEVREELGITLKSNT